MDPTETIAQDEIPAEESTADLMAIGRRHLAVQDYAAAVDTFACCCERLAKEHGEAADECAEAYLRYGKSLLGLYRQESGVLGDGVPGSGNPEEQEDDEEDGEENGDEAENGKDEGEEKTNGHNGPDEETKETTNPEPSTVEESKDTAEAKPESAENGVSDAPGPSNGEANGDDSAVDLENDEDVDNLQLAWEMLDLARSLFEKRVESGGGDAARGHLADVYRYLGEVALESETYDKAVVDMQKCLELQKEIHQPDDRRIAETHYEIGLAHSLASNFEDAIIHFKNAANILQTRIKTLENPATAAEDGFVKKYTNSDPQYSVEGEIKELRGLLPEINEKIQDMMDYKAETIKRVRESLFPSNGDGASSSSSGLTSSSSSEAPKPAAKDISHLIKRKRKSSENESGGSAAKKPST